MNGRTSKLITLLYENLHICARALCRVSCVVCCEWYQMRLVVSSTIQVHVLKYIGINENRE